MFSHVGDAYDEKLEIILRPDVVHTHPVCVSVYLHIVVFAPHMLPSDKDMHGSSGTNSMVFKGAKAFQAQFDAAFSEIASEVAKPKKGMVSRVKFDAFVTITDLITWCDSQDSWQSFSTWFEIPESVEGSHSSGFGGHGIKFR